MKKIITYLSVVLIIILIILNLVKEKEYTRNIFYMDTYISVKINTNKRNINEILEEIENIYKYYDSLTNKYNPNSDISKINNVVGEYIINSDLYDLLEYSIGYYDKTNGLFNINMGNVTSIWKKYRELGSGIPTKEELDVNTDINAIKLLGNNKVLVNNANIDLGGIVKGYVTKIVGEYLDKNGINDYIINAGGNVIVGSRNKKYKIGVEDPDNNGVLATIKGENICVVTSSGYNRFYEYNNKKYHHIIDPSTNYPSNNMKSVTIISKDCALADILSTTLFLMDIDAGLTYIKDYNVEAIFYSNDNKIIKSEGIAKYE